MDFNEVKCNFSDDELTAITAMLEDRADWKQHAKAITALKRELVGE